MRTTEMVLNIRTLESHVRRKSLMRGLAGRRWKSGVLYTQLAGVLPDRTLRLAGGGWRSAQSRVTRWTPTRHKRRALHGLLAGTLPDPTKQPPT
jgi:hypothetical protein